MLGGVGAPHHPALTALGRQVALDEVFRRCASDAECKTAFGDVKRLFATVERSVRTTSIRTPFPGANGHITIELRNAQFADRLGFMLYDVNTARYIPYLLWEAARNTWGPFVTLAFRQSYEFYTPGGSHDAALNRTAISRGFYYSDVCAEFVPLITSRDRERDAPTFISNTRNDAYADMCKLWAVPARAPAKGKIAAPTLILSNRFDPATPWFVAKASLPEFAKVRQITNYAWGHNTRYDCLKSLFIPFLETLQFEGLDIRCANEPQTVTFAKSL